MNHDILLVRLSSMGDLIHTLPAVTDLSRQRPDLNLHWLCEAAFADIARLHPFVKQVQVIRWRQWRTQLFQAATWREIRAVKQWLRAQNYSQVIDSQGLIKSAIWARWAHAPIGGLDKQSAREAWAAAFYRQTVAVPKGRDAVWRNRRLFSQLFDYQIKNPPDFGVRLPADFSGCLKNLPRFYHVALHATSRDSKLWKQANWLALLNKINQADGLPVLLIWGNEAERARSLEMAAALPFVRVCPKMSLLQAADLLSKSRSVLGVDTGLLHLANAVNVPVVGIYTDSDPVKTGVQVSDWAKNLGGVGQEPGVEDVFEAWQQCLQSFQAA